MGASSVTGTGYGDAHPGVKGPGNGRNVYKSNLSPSVVAAGSITLPPSSPVGSETVTLPEPLSLSYTAYAVIATNETGAVTVSNKTDVEGKFASFDLGGVGETDWIVVLKG